MLELDRMGLIGAAFGNRGPLADWLRPRYGGFGVGKEEGGSELRGSCS